MLAHPLGRLGLREAGNDLDEPREHEPRHPWAQELDQLRRLDTHPAPEHDEDLDVVLAELRRNPDGGGFGDGWMVVDDRLHLERRDVLAPSPDGVLEPVDEVAVAVPVHPEGITGVKPSIPPGGDGRLGLTQITGVECPGGLRPDDQLTGLPGRYLVIELVNDTDLVVRVTTSPAAAGFPVRYPVGEVD